MYPCDLQFIKAETAYRRERAAELMGPATGPGIRRLRGAVRDLLARHSSRVAGPGADRAVGVNLEVTHHAY
jgi:hypothetical protein